MAEFQTKDFACEMFTHVIRADGTLVLCTAPIDPATGLYACQPVLTPQLHYTGTCWFYAFDGPNCKPGTPFRQFMASWDDGRLIGIEEKSG
jgi:hypothetical protein